MQLLVRIHIVRIKNVGFQIWQLSVKLPIRQIKNLAKGSRYGIELESLIDKMAFNIPIIHQHHPLLDCQWCTCAFLQLHTRLKCPSLIYMYGSKTNYLFPEWAYDP